MIEGWVLWLVLVGLAVGMATAWLLLVRLPRDEEDVGAAERQVEAAWIAAIIERHGGVAPRTFVEEVLDLHQAYLREPRPPEPPEPRNHTVLPPPGPVSAPRQTPGSQWLPVQRPPGQVPPGQVPPVPPGTRPPTRR